MSTYVFPLNEKPVTLLFAVQAKRPVAIRSIGYDKERGAYNTMYFNKVTYLNTGINVIEFPMPLSPRKLAIEFLSIDGDESAYTIHEAGNKALVTSKVRFEPIEEKFFDLLFRFCKNASTLPAGVYRSFGCPYTITYTDSIIDEQEGELQTPARADHYTNDIHFAQRNFIGYTVPMRVVIGLHEFTHLHNHTHDETESDIYAAHIALCKGFSQSETGSGFTKVFKDSKENNERVEKVSNYIDSFAR